MWTGADERLLRRADAKAEVIRRQIVRLAAKQGAKDVYVQARAHRGSGYYDKPTGAVALTFTTVVRQRTVNNLKKPFDLDEIVRLLVEKWRYDRDIEKARLRREALSEKFDREVEKLRSEYPRLPFGIWLSSDGDGIVLHVSRLTGKQARQILAVLTDRFPVEDVG